MKFLHLSKEAFYKDLLQDLEANKESSKYKLYSRTYLEKIPSEIA